MKHHARYTNFQVQNPFTLNLHYEQSLQRARKRKKLPGAALDTEGYHHINLFFYFSFNSRLHGWRALSMYSPLSFKYRDNSWYCLNFKCIGVQDKSWCLASLRQMSYEAMHLISLETLIPWRHFLDFTTLLVKYFRLWEDIVHDQETQIIGELWTALVNWWV